MTKQQLVELEQLVDDVDVLRHEPWLARDGLREVLTEVRRLRALCREAVKWTAGMESEARSAAHEAEILSFRTRLLAAVGES